MRRGEVLPVSNEKMREKFEAAYENQLLVLGGTFDPAVFSRQLDGEYVVPSVRCGWWAWQESREALVIELPADCLLSRDGLDENYQAGDIRDQMVESIKAAGIRVRS